MNVFWSSKKRTILGSVAAIAVLGGTIGGLSACSGSGSSGPPTASSVLSSDGYTPSAAYTTALQGGLASAGSSASSEVTSSIAGTNSAGDIQGVVVFDNAADATAGAQGAGSTPGIAVVTNGDVVTLTGSESAWAALG